MKANANIIRFSTYTPVVGLVDEGLDLGVAPRPSALEGVLDGRDRLPLGRRSSVSSTPGVHVLCLEGVDEKDD